MGHGLETHKGSPALLFGSQEIGRWDEARLKRFIQAAINTSVPSIPPALTLSEITSTRKLFVKDEMELSPQAIKYLKSVLGL